MKTELLCFHSKLKRGQLIWIIVAIMSLLCPRFLWADGFLDAVRSGNLSKVQRLAGENPKLVSLNANGHPPLHWAVVGNRIGVAKWLLENGADANQRSAPDQRTPVFDARTPEMARLLIERGAKLNLTNEWSSDPLREAIRRNHLGVVDVFIEAGMSLDFESIVELRNVELAARMLAKNPGLAKAARKPLYEPAENGDLEMVRLLLQHGADPDLDYGFTNVSGPFTPVSNAVTSGHYQIAELLLQHGASANVSGGRNHDSLLLFAIAYRDVKFTKLMLKHGADLNYIDGWGRTIKPLHVAAALGGGSAQGRASLVGQPPPLKRDRLQALQKVRSLVRAGANVSDRDANGATPLLCAAIAGHRDVCEFLLDNGAKLDLGSACLLGKSEFVTRLLTESPELIHGNHSPLKQPALHWAVRAGDIQMVRMMLKKGATVDARAPELEYLDAEGFSSRKLGAAEGSTALHFAAAMANENIVRALLDEGANPELKSSEHSYRQSPLEIALNCERLDIVRLLLDRGAKVELDGESEYQLTEVTDAGLLGKILDSARIDFSGSRGAELLAEALRKENEIAADGLIARGARLDFLSACQFGRIDDVRRMIKKDPTLTQTAVVEYPKPTPVALAVENGHVGIVQLLMEHGATLSIPKGHPATLLHLAAISGHLDVIELLLKNGFSIDTLDESGSSLLHAAALGSQPHIARYLVSRGADVNARDSNGATPLHAVGGRVPGWENEDFDERLQQAKETARILLDAGASVNAKDKYIQTPLHYAAFNGLETVAEVLLSRGADVNPRNYCNKTPLYEARTSIMRLIPVRQPNPVVALLRDQGAIN